MICISIGYILRREGSHYLASWRIFDKNNRMKNLLRAILAGIGAKKIGGGKCGCIGTIVVFLILYWLLGYVFEVF